MSSSKANDNDLTEEERTRMKEFGTLFNRRSSINRDLLEELFRKEPSEYTQTIFRYASRIYHCLKEDQVNPVLKALSATKDEQVQVKKVTIDVPKIDYANEQQKRRTIKLAFSVLRCLYFESKSKQTKIKVCSLFRSENSRRTFGRDTIL